MFQDVLDALFNILMSNSDSDVYDDMVFECLLYIIGLVSDRKYQHFQPVLDLYISESFSATLAYKKLIAVLRKRIDNVSNGDCQERDLLLKTMKSLQYCMRFIVESRLLFTEYVLFVIYNFLFHALIYGRKCFIKLSDYDECNKYNCEYKKKEVFYS